MNAFVFTLQEENSALQSLDLMFNDIQTDGAEVLAKALQVHISLLHTVFTDTLLQACLQSGC